MASANASTVKRLGGMGSGPTPAPAIMWLQNGWLDRDESASDNIGIEIHNSLSKERHDDRRNGVFDTAGSCASTAMVHDSCHAREEPLMRAIADIINVFGGLASKVRPALRDDGPHSRGVDCLHDSVEHARRIVEDDTSKAKVHRRWAGFEESVEIVWRCVFGVLAKEETADV